jgi:acetate kinase
VYRIVKYIGSYAAAMGGLDAIVFTGGIGENASAIRAKVLQPLGFLGAKLDLERNESTERERAITTADSTVQAWVIPTNEELAIADKTARAVTAAS